MINRRMQIMLIIVVIGIFLIIGMSRVSEFFAAKSNAMSGSIILSLKPEVLSFYI